MTTSKIKSRSEIAALVKVLKEEGKTIAFTSGAFDLLHAGHADYLEKARAQCDVLVVGVNSDASVQRYKGKDRPIIKEAFRSRLVASLASVDLVFLFDERRNKTNIEILKPHKYIKAGDYNRNSLTSAEMVESYGGEVVFVPVTQSISSSDIISRIAGMNARSEWISKGKAEYQQLPKGKAAPAVFLDRDGTINREIHYLSDPEQFELLPDAASGIKRFQDMGYRLIVVTNQPGIGMGYYTKEDFYKVNLRMLKELSEFGILIDKIYFCPHSKAEGCDCRKPGQALIRRAQQELSIDLTQSFFIGDQEGDIKVGIRAGMKTIRIDSKGCSSIEWGEEHCCNTLLEAAEWVLRLEREAH